MTIPLLKSLISSIIKLLWIQVLPRPYSQSLKLIINIQSPERKRGPSQIITSPSHHKGQWQRGHLIKEEDSLLKSHDDETENQAQIINPIGRPNSQNHSLTRNQSVNSSEAEGEGSQKKTPRRPPSMGINSLHNASLNNTNHSWIMISSKVHSYNSF